MAALLVAMLTVLAGILTNPVSDLIPQEMLLRFAIPTVLAPIIVIFVVTPANVQRSKRERVVIGVLMVWQRLRPRAHRGVLTPSVVVAYTCDSWP